MPSAAAISLPDDVEILKQMVQHLLEDMSAKDREILNLKCQLEALRRRIFGRKSEKIDPNQLVLFEDLTRQLQEAEARQAVEEPAASVEKPASSEKPASQAKTNGHRRRVLPPDLPVERIEIPVPEQDRVCSCGQVMEPIGEETTSELEYVPASFIIRQYARPKYACKQCAEGVVIAELPARPIPKGIPGPGLLAQVLTGKYADHLPLHRQHGIFLRHQIDLSISTLCDWVRDMADLLLPVVLVIKQQILRSYLINTDDTPVLVQDRAGKPAGKGHLWAYIGAALQVVFEFTETRSRDGPLKFLGNYHGYVQADAYKGYDILFQPQSDGTPSPRIEVGCWAHTRRYFYDARHDDRLRCTEMLGLIQKLYQVEDLAKGLEPDARLALRQEQSAPLLQKIRERLDAWSIELLPKSPVAQAVHYARAQWTPLGRFLEDGRLPLDNNIAERILRIAAVGRKNWMFFGSDAGGHRAAVIYSLVASCRLCHIDPFAYLRDTIAQACQPGFQDFASLTPLAWKASHRTQPTA